MSVEDAMDGSYLLGVVQLMIEYKDEIIPPLTVFKSAASTTLRFDIIIIWLYNINARVVFH